MAKGSGNSGTWITVGVIGLGLYGAYKLFIKPEVITPLKMQANVQRMRIGKIYGMKFKNDSVTFKFPIENPNNDPLIVKAIVGDVYIISPKGTMKIGTVQHYGTDIIKPVAATNFDLAVKVNLVNEFLLISDMIRGNIRGLAIAFDGTVNANGRPWPVKEQVQIS